MLRVDPSFAAFDAVPADAAPSGAGAAARVVAERQLAQLTRLAEIGMDVAECVGRQARAHMADAALADDPAKAPAHDGDAPHEAALGDLGLAFARVSRAVRLTLFLQSRLMKDLAGQGQAEAAARRTRIHRLVERAIEAERGGDEDGEDEIERLSDEAWERLTEDEDWEVVASRPVAETVGRICAALGVELGEAAGGCAPSPSHACGAGPSLSPPGRGVAAAMPLPGGERSRALQRSG